MTWPGENLAVGYSMPWFLHGPKRRSSAESLHWSRLQMSPLPHCAAHYTLGLVGGRPPLPVVVQTGP